MYLSRTELAGFERLSDQEKCRSILETVRLFVFYNRFEIPRLKLPPLYASGARYKFQERLMDDWQDAARVNETKAASCNSLAAYRCAELQLAGEDARPYICTQSVTRKDGTKLDVFHVIVHRPYPSPYDWEDPSATLGMPLP